MEPHPRKDVPPRREPGGSHERPDEAVEGHEPAAGYEAGPYLEPGTYDPGAALVDPGQGYVDPGQGYDDGGQGYVDGGQGYVDGGQGYVDGGQGYVDGGFDPPPIAPPPAPFQHVPRVEETPVVSRSSGAKKKVARRGPRPKPVAGRGAPGPRGRRAPQRPVYDSGFSPMAVFLTLVAIAMLAVVALVLQPKDLSGLAGYPAEVSLGGEKPRNLLAEAQRAMIDRNSVLVFSEEEVNRYLAQRLSGEQGGMMGSFVKFRGVYVDFSPGAAEIVIEREFFGMPTTVSVVLRNERFRQQIVYKSSGWTIGKISMGSRNVKPVIDLFLRLRDSCIDEFHALQQMREVTFEENQVALNPII